MNMDALLAELRSAVGRRNVWTGARATRSYRRGHRFGFGPCLAVAAPTSLMAMWRALEACVCANAIVILQASNTGLTGGSTPDGEYDRDVVIISTRKLTGVRPIRGGQQVLCRAGATLYELERTLAPLGREPHSVIGSSCIGASVVGGISNNSGGALVRRGPAYTEMALFAQLEADGCLRLVNRLGINLGDTPEQILGRLDRWDFGEADVCETSPSACSDHDYAAHVRRVDAETPARFNADPRRLRDASGCAGKIATFMVRLDTFPAEKGARTFYIGTDDAAELESLRREILTTFDHLPISAEYVHRDAFLFAERYGKDTYLAVRYLGTQRLPKLFAAKSWSDRVAPGLGDAILQVLGRLHPPHLPTRLRDFGHRFAHQLILTVTQDGFAEARGALQRSFPSATGDMFECDGRETAAAMRHRFAVASSAVRYRALYKRRVSDIAALDIALRRNETEWFERLPADLADQTVHRLYYGHFLCHVMHQDYVLRADADPAAFERAVLERFDARGAEYPAEHNVGHLYHAKRPLADFYRSLDPTNAFNPGIGHTSRGKYWS
jgi:D-lactate dehydrogenase